MNDPIKKLADIYEALENGQKAVVRDVKVNILQMQDTIRDLESTLARQPLPEAAASLTAKVIDRNTQIEWLVTVREAGRAKLLISAMPLINEWLAEQGLISFDVYAEERRAERTAGGQGRVGAGEQDNSFTPAPLPPSSPADDAFSFKADTLTKSTEGDKVYYKVKGGRFASYGVTIWPETLQAAGFDLDTLAGVTSLNGYTAYYVLNDKGKPAKVVGLAKG